MSNQLSQEEINAILEDSNTDGSNSNEAIEIGRASCRERV